MTEHTFFLQREIHGDPNVGLYGFATDKYAIVGIHNEKLLKDLKELLLVPVFSLRLLKLDLIRIFITGNAKHIIAPGFLPDDELDELKSIAKKAGVKLAVINTEHALGNLVLMNDHGALISPLIKKHKEELQNVLGIPTEVGQISLLNIVGSLGFATSKGCIVHPAALNNEAELIEKLLKAKVDTGSVSFGSPYPGAGLIGNANGFLASKNTAGPELERIAETLGFVDVN